MSNKLKLSHNSQEWRLLVQAQTVHCPYTENSASKTKGPNSPFLYFFHWLELWIPEGKFLMLPHVILRGDSSHTVILTHLFQSALQAIIRVKLRISLSHTSSRNPKTKSNQPFTLWPPKGARKPESAPPEQALQKSSLKCDSWQYTEE